MKQSTNVAWCVAICGASLAAGCTTEATQPDPSQPPANEVATLDTVSLYLEGAPSTVTVAWFEPEDDSCPLANHCPPEPEFVIRTISCDGCLLPDAPDTGSHPAGSTAISVVPQRRGNETITVGLEDIGPSNLGTRTLSTTIFADHITGFDAECWIASAIASWPCAGTRTADDDVMLLPVVHTAQGGSDNMAPSILSLVLSKPETDLPGANSDAPGPHGEFAIHIPADTTASTATIQWQVTADQMLSVTAPIPPLFH